MNKKGVAISGIIYTVLIIFIFLILGILSILATRKVTLDKLKTNVKNELNNEVISQIYRDSTGSNPPILLTNMIPIKYVNNNWVYADENQKWYDYSNKEWANAVVLKSNVTKNVGEVINESDIALWYVWIPRYKYTIFNGNNESATLQVIDITFEKGKQTTGTVKCHDAINQTSNGNKISEICSDTTQENNAIVNNVSTYTHPAFCLGTKNTDGTCNGSELTGFWFGKFEISGTEEITILPNANSLRNKTVSELYEAIQGISDYYKISNADSHMAKNMEWGAVAYLKQSSYGLGLTDIGINNYYNDGFKTGCGATSGSSSSTTCNAYDTENGMKASTTGNIYGVYDMSGGANEYTMGNMVNSSGEFYSSSAGFITDKVPLSKYYDSYTFDDSLSSHARGKLGDNTKETLSTFGSTTGSWNNDFAFLPYNERSWFLYGGSYTNASNSGVFSFSHHDGHSYVNYSARAVLSK